MIHLGTTQGSRTDGELLVAPIQPWGFALRLPCVMSKVVDRGIHLSQRFGASLPEGLNTCAPLGVDGWIARPAF